MPVLSRCWHRHSDGGLLIEGFVAARRTATLGQRLIDTVIVLGETKRWMPRSIRSVAVCTADDAVLRPLLERHKGCEVWVYPAQLAVS